MKPVHLEWRSSWHVEQVEVPLTWVSRLRVLFGGRVVMVRTGTVKVFLVSTPPCSLDEAVSLRFFRDLMGMR